MTNQKLLIIEDEIEIIKFLSRFLKREGYIVDYALDGEEAINKIKEYSYPLILCDICLPDIQGYDLIKKLKSYNPLTNIIIITAYSSMDNVVACIENGAVDYFTKPFSDMDIIIDAIHFNYKKIQRWKKSIPFFK